MSVVLNPYLGFRDNAREALEFYRSVFGGTLNMSTFAEMGAAQEPAEEELIMHGQLDTDNGLTLMGSDTPHSMSYTPGDTYSVSLSGDDDATLSGYWDKLAADGAVTMPLEAAPWGAKFGMCRDKFGVSWLVNIAGSPR